jgi:hypothetical protein
LRAKEQKRKRKVWFQSIRSFFKIKYAQAPPKAKKGPVRIRNLSLFSFVVRDPGGTSSQGKRKKDTHK